MESFHATKRQYFQMSMVSGWNRVGCIFVDHPYGKSTKLPHKLLIGTARSRVGSTVGGVEWSEEDMQAPKLPPSPPSPSLARANSNSSRIRANIRGRLNIIPPDPPSISTSTPSPTTPKLKLSKGSAQLNRWSRARTLRSGRRLERSKNQDATTITSPSPSRSPPSGVVMIVSDETTESSEEDDVISPPGGKVIYMVSDGTGWTLEHAVNASLGQFEHCLVDRACAVNTHLFSGVI